MYWGKAFPRDAKYVYQRLEYVCTSLGEVLQDLGLVPTGQLNCLAISFWRKEKNVEKVYQAIENLRHL